MCPSHGQSCFLRLRVEDPELRSGELLHLPRHHGLVQPASPGCACGGVVEKGTLHYGEGDVAL